jgi:hypothetical protein
MLRLMIAGFFLVPLAAQANQAEPTTPTPKAPVEYTFSPEEVNGGVQGPDAKPVTVRQRRPALSLIRVRRDFGERLLQSAETL